MKQSVIYSLYVLYLTNFAEPIPKPMKVAVFSDIQANFPAMEATVAHILAWNPDLVVMNGDLVNRGPLSLPCLELMENTQREHGWIALRGNHEDFVMECETNPPTDDIEAELRRFTDWSYQQLGPRNAALASWADHYCFHGENHPGSWVHVTHGTLAGNRCGVQPDTPDEVLAERIPSDLDVFVTSHTHRPLQRQLGHTQIINVGSAGSPFDGDPRGSYGQLTFSHGKWETKIVRFDYDREQAGRDYFDSGFIDQGGPIARLIYQEWYRATGFMQGWHKSYRKAVLAGDISLTKAIDDFILTLD